MQFNEETACICKRHLQLLSAKKTADNGQRMDDKEELGKAIFYSLLYVVINATKC